MSDSLFPIVQSFMQGKITVSNVCEHLNPLDGVIIKMKPSVTSLGYDGCGGPYIFIWHSEDSNPMVWASRDDFLDNLGYRGGNDCSDDIKLKRSIAAVCGNYEAVEFHIPDYSSLSGTMRERLDLDSDLYRNNNTDRELSHNTLQSVFNSLAKLAAPAVSPVTTQTQSRTGETQMSNKITAIVATAKAAAYTAAEIQAGKALNIAAIKAAKAKAPMMVRGYMDHPAAPAVIALAVITAAEFMPAGPVRVKVGKAANLMLTAAVCDGADKFLDIEGLIDKVFAGLPDEAKALIG